jgi:hypothetical protein
MGNQASRILEGCPLVCLLKHWKDLDMKVFNGNNSSFTAPRPAQYPLGDGEKWPERGGINYNTILQLATFCKRED